MQELTSMWSSIHQEEEQNVNKNSSGKAFNEIPDGYLRQVHKYLLWQVMQWKLIEALK